MLCVLQRLTKNLRTPICYFFFRQCDDSEVELTQLIDLNSNVEEHQEQADDALLNTITPSFVFDTNGGVKLSLQLPPTFTNNGNSTLSF